MLVLSNFSSDQLQSTIKEDNFYVLDKNPFDLEEHWEKWLGVIEHIRKAVSSRRWLVGKNEIVEVFWENFSNHLGRMP